MDSIEFKEMIDDLGLTEHIEIQAIPNLDLYMDQVITFFEEKLKHTKRYESDKLLTKTMINNYAKDKVLMPAHKKKYTKNHIILMILLYNLKQILTISDIKDLFGVVLKNDEVDEEKLKLVYQTYIDLKEKSADFFKRGVQELEVGLSEKIEIQDESIKDMLTVIMLTEKANYYKRLAEKIIDKKLK